MNNNIHVLIYLYYLNIICVYKLTNYIGNYYVTYYVIKL